VAVCLVGHCRAGGKRRSTVDTDQYGGRLRASRRSLSANLRSGAGGLARTEFGQNNLRQFERQNHSSVGAAGARNSDRLPAGILRTRGRCSVSRRRERSTGIRHLSPEQSDWWPAKEITSFCRKFTGLGQSTSGTLRSPMKIHTENTVLNANFQTCDQTLQLFDMDFKNIIEPTTLINVISGVISVSACELLVTWK